MPEGIGTARRKRRHCSAILRTWRGGGSIALADGGQELPSLDS
jgi:hypothetical protein